MAFYSVIPLSVTCFVVGFINLITSDDENKLIFMILLFYIQLLEQIL